MSIFDLWKEQYIGDVALMNSSLLPQREEKRGRSARKLFTNVVLLGFAALGCVFVSAFSPMITMVLFAILAVVSLIITWRYLLYYQIFVATPTSEIDAAPFGLNELQVNMVSEDGSYLTSPIGKKKCVYYKVELHEIISNGKSSSDRVMAQLENGVKTLLTDGGGYATADFESAEIECEIDSYIGSTGAKNIGYKEADPIINYLRIAGTFSTPDFRKVYPDIRFEKGRGRVYFCEKCFSVDRTYFVVGGVSDLSKDFKNKPLKLVGIDQNTKIFSILPESKKKAIASLRKYAIVCGTLAVILFVLSALLFYTNVWWTCAFIVKHVGCIPLW